MQVAEHVCIACWSIGGWTSVSQPGHLPAVPSHHQQLFARYQIGPERSHRRLVSMTEKKV